MHLWNFQSANIAKSHDFLVYLHLMKCRNGDGKLFDGYIENGTETRLR